MDNKIIIKILVIVTIFLLINTSVVLAIEYNLQYDANGNLIQGKDKYFEYNTLNQLWKVREGNINGNILEEYYYDQDGNRLLKIEYESGQVKQEIYYIDENYIQIVNSTGTFNEVYYYDNSGLVAVNGTDSRLKAYHSDHLGSTNLVTNESGSVVEEDYYEPYGNELQDSNSRYTYTGKEKDSTGLMDFKARQYNPEQGQFIQPDKQLPEVYDPQQLNRYAYARNNPYKYVDKEGQATTISDYIVERYGGLPGGYGGLQIGEDINTIITRIQIGQEQNYKNKLDIYRTYYPAPKEGEFSISLIGYSSIPKKSGWSNPYDPSSEVLDKWFNLYKQNINNIPPPIPGTTQKVDINKNLISSSNKQIEQSSKVESKIKEDKQTTVERIKTTVKNIYNFVIGGSKK